MGGAAYEKEKRHFNQKERFQYQTMPPVEYAGMI
jgi:hypothetical protein